ncbi:MAG: ribosomal protection-like ABC-F family protein [Chloroflexota bacterium]
MAIINGNNLGVRFGADEIFSGISFELAADARTGLVGPNGIGKTTLLRLIRRRGAIGPPGRSPAGSLDETGEPDAGSLRVDEGLRIGYLAQEAAEELAGHEHTLWEELLGAFDATRAHEVEMRDLEQRMTRDSSPELLAQYGRHQEAFERGGGYDYESRIEQTLTGLGFPSEQWHQPVSRLSGGQKTRALLARLLLEQPDLLILDEPSNHLDIASLQWLEQTLHRWPGALLVASHDRYFLDHVVDHIWEMSAGGLEAYRGNYSAYLQQRQERWERNQKIYQREMEDIHREMELIRRYIAWRKFDQAWGKLRLLSRKLAAIEQYGLFGIQGKKWSEMGIRSHRAMMTLDEAHQSIKHIPPPPGRPPRLHLHLNPAKRGGDAVLRTERLRVGYDGKPLLAVGDLVVGRQERVALLGPNGAGKTTLLRTVLGEIPPVAGSAGLGGGLITGYLAQTQENLLGVLQVMDELMTHKQGMKPSEARSYLARFLFRGEDVFKPVGKLSGGERARLALAILMLEGVNLLLLDEPTNHLDIPAREVLEEALEAFDGTVILVSHDRYLVDRLATQVWQIRDGRLEVFRGTYAEMLAAEEAAGSTGALEQHPTGGAEGEPIPAAKNGHQARRQARRLEALEDHIIAAEAAVAELSRRLAAETDDYQLLAGLSEEYKEAQDQLEELIAEWEDLAAKAPASVDRG